jgi:hypothetical protein
MLDNSFEASQRTTFSSNPQQITFDDDRLEEMEEISNAKGQPQGGNNTVNCECGCNKDRDAVVSLSLKVCN